MTAGRWVPMGRGERKAGCPMGARGRANIFAGQLNGREKKEKAQIFVLFV
jgi:hypothetical protein